MTLNTISFSTPNDLDQSLFKVIQTRLSIFLHKQKEAKIGKTKKKGEEMMERKKYVVLVLFLFVLVGMVRSNPQPNGRTIEKKQFHFVLVHGACHGAWCWYKVATLLRLGGHRVTALDLAASGIDSKQINELRSISDYFQPLMKLMESVPTEERVILVAHSFGGLGISKAMEVFPKKIVVAVFVTALMPGPSFNVSTIAQESFRRQGSQMDNRFNYDEGPDNPPTTFNFGPNYMSSNVYQLCPPEDVTMATMLVRPIRLYSEEDVSKVIVVSRKKYGSIKRVYVVSEEDKVMKETFQLWMIKNNPTDQVKKITGSDHMVMLSKSQELSICLQEIAEDFS